MPKDIEKIGEISTKPREMPAPVKIAQAVLEGLEAARAKKLRKSLPAYAMTLARQGKEVTAKVLHDALAKGDDTVMGPRHVFNRVAAPETIEQRYARIAKDMPKREYNYWADDPEFSYDERMFRAAERGDLAMVQDMIEKGANIKASDDQALRGAAENGHLEVVKFLVESATDVKAYNDVALRWAVQYGHLEVVKFLVEKDADIESIPNTGLHDIIRHENYNILHFLAQRGVDMGRLSPEDQDKIKPIFKNIDDWVAYSGDYPLEEFADKKPGSFDVKSAETIAKLIKAEGYETWSANRYAYNTLRLFGTDEKVMDYFEKWAKPSHQPMHDAVQMISAPANAPDLKSWADAVMQHGPEMARLVKFATNIPQPLKSADGKTYSLTKTREEAAKFAYVKGHENPELAALFNKYQMDEDDFKDALKLVKKYKAKKQNRVPDVTIAGENFGMPKAMLKKLPDGDYRGLILGQITDCCQSIGGAGEDCAKHGFSSENGGFYVVTVNDNKKGEEIIGQSWAWRGKNDELVLDSLETLGKRISSKQWADLTKAFAEALAKTDIKEFRIGQGGATPRDLPFETAKKPATPKDYDGYRDSNSQYKIS